MSPKQQGFIPVFLRVWNWELGWDDVNDVAGRTLVFPMIFYRKLDYLYLKPKRTEH